MDVDDYRAARRTRLVEIAVGLGLPAAEAERVVDRVIQAQQRSIRRADDPDDVVVPALREEVLGSRPHRASTAVLVLVALVVAAVAFALVPTGDRDTQDPDDLTATVPSLLGLTTAEATAALGRRQIALRVESVPQCNPAGQVLGSVPPMGTAVGADDIVTVIATSSPQWDCPGDASSRAEAWTFLRFLVSGSTRPDFATEVRLLVDGEQVAVVSGTARPTSSGWRSAVRGPVLRHLSRPVANDLGQPIVSVTHGVPPASTCDHPSATPTGVADAATRLMLTVGGEGAAGGCELTIDLFEDRRGAISAVALWSPGPDPALGPPPWVRPRRP